MLSKKLIKIKGHKTKRLPKIFFWLMISQYSGVLLSLLFYEVRFMIFFGITSLTLLIGICLDIILNVIEKNQRIGE